MGFTLFEKKCFRKTLRDEETIKNLLIESYPTEILQFFKQENLLRQIRDYAIIPEKQKLHKPEHLTLTYVLDAETFIYDIFVQWHEFLSPPVTLYLSGSNVNLFQFHIQMDCSLLLTDMANELRYNWAQVRSYFYS